MVFDSLNAPALDPADYQRRGQALACRGTIAVLSADAAKGLLAHRLLVETQEAIAIILHGAETRFELFENSRPDGRSTPSRAGTVPQPFQVVVTARGRWPQWTSGSPISVMLPAAF